MGLYLLTLIRFSGIQNDIAEDVERVRPWLAGLHRLSRPVRSNEPNRRAWQTQSNPTKEHPNFFTFHFFVMKLPKTVVHSLGVPTSVAQLGLAEERHQLCLPGIRRSLRFFREVVQNDLTLLTCLGFLTFYRVFFGVWCIHFLVTVCV